MQFNETSTKTGIIQEINDICQSDNNSYPIESKTRRVNEAMDNFFTLAFQADGRWTFDDVNNAAPPIDTQAIVSGTNRYKLGAFTEKIFKLIRLEILDSNGKGLKLTSEDANSLSDTFQELYLSSSMATGTPSNYILSGDFIYLRPKPNYSLAAALKCFFNRPATRFVYTDTTKEPGIPLMFHSYICRKASLPYLIEFQKPQKNDIATLIQLDEIKITNYFGNREKGVHNRLTPIYEDNR